MLLTACGTDTPRESVSPTLVSETLEQSSTQSQETIVADTEKTTGSEEAQPDLEAEGVVELQPNTPVIIDGQEFVIKDTAANPEDDEGIIVTAQYGSQTVDVEETLAIKSIYFVKNQQKRYVLVETSTYDDWRNLFVLTLENGAVTMTDQTAGSITEVPDQPQDAFSITSRVYVLGTYGGTRPYLLQDGKLVADSTLYFTLEDGTSGNFTVDLNDEGQYAGTIGGVSENDLFQDLPYAG